MDIAYLQTEQHVNATVCYGPAVISVRNLNFSIQGPQDAWGRVYREQPLSVSLKVVMKEPFGSSSAADAVAPDTVHYGLLSKAAIATLERLSSTWNGGANSDASTVPPTLVGLVYEIYSDLTGITTSGEPRQDRTKKPFLDVSLIQCLVVTAHLRKASLLGSGVSVTMMSTFGIRGDRLEATNYSMSMRLHELRVPTLIGVNANERLAKQVVVANVEIGHFIDVQDIHGQIEAVVVQVNFTSFPLFHSSYWLL